MRAPPGLKRSAQEVGKHNGKMGKASGVKRDRWSVNESPGSQFKRPVVTHQSRITLHAY